MKTNSSSFFKQIRNNSVAIISLFIAVSSLSYNTWRNEQTEYNRNQRQASFEILVTLNELQQVVFHHYYDKDTNNKGNLRTGWAHVLTIGDFSQLLNKQHIMLSSKLNTVWSDNWQNLDTQQASVDSVLLAIDNTRNGVITLLKSLD